MQQMHSTSWHEYSWAMIGIIYAQCSSVIGRGRRQRRSYGRCSTSRSSLSSSTRRVSRSAVRPSSSSCSWSSLSHGNNRFIYSLIDYLLTSILYYLFSSLSFFLSSALLELAWFRSFDPIVFAFIGRFRLVDPVNFVINYVMFNFPISWPSCWCSDWLVTISWPSCLFSDWLLQISWPSNNSLVVTELSWPSYLFSD